MEMMELPSQEVFWIKYIVDINLDSNIWKGEMELDEYFKFKTTWK